MARAIIKAKSDIFFRYLFGNPKNEVYLVDSINAVLQDCDTGSVDHITSAKVANPYNMSELSSIKQSILDIKATDDMRRTINIEMQLIGKDDYIKRSLYYWSKLYSDQLHEGSRIFIFIPLSAFIFSTSRLTRLAKIRMSAATFTSITTDKYV